MNFDWTDYLTLAKGLVPNLGSTLLVEASARAAISRSYYAAFCSARNYLRDSEGFVPTNTARDHGLVPSAFDNSLTAMRRKIARDLYRLSDFRRLADYDDCCMGNPTEQAKASVLMAEDVLARIGGL